MRGLAGSNNHRTIPPHSDKKDRRSALHVRGVGGQTPTLAAPTVAAFFMQQTRPCEIRRYNHSVCDSGEHGKYILVGGKGLTKYAIYVCEPCAYGRLKNEAPSI